MDILEVKGIKKHFGGIKALDGCTLSVDEETITGLIGPNGAGKTTLFNVMTGFYKIDSGRIIFQGEDITGLRPHETAERGLARTFQITRPLDKMTVLENMMMVHKEQAGEKIRNIWIRPGTISRQEERIEEKAHRLLEFFELERLADEYAGALSGGQKRLLEIARVMMLDPAMILLDEPTAGVNPVLQDRILNRIMELRDSGKTFLVVEHDMDVVMGISEKVIAMSEGKKIAEGSPEEIRDNEKVLDAYLGG